MRKLFVFIAVLSLLAYATTTIAQGSECTPQGIGEEEDFAIKVCKEAAKFGLHPELVNSFGAGQVDIFIPIIEAIELVSNEAKLRYIVVSLTEWSKDNYSKFNVVTLTFVGGDRKIARGEKIGTKKVRVTLYY